MKDVTLLDSFQIMMMANYMGRNITLIYGAGDQWSTETGMVEDIDLQRREWIYPHWSRYIIFLSYSIQQHISFQEAWIEYLLLKIIEIKL